jgi:uncharacterized protein YPO0396
MDMSNAETLLPLIPFAVTVTVIGTAWITVKKIASDSQKARKEHADEILQVAREEDALLKAKLEARIESVKAQLSNLELNVNKDLAHLKETYSGEIKNLGQKIEDLRSELKNQHGQLVSLLTEMVKKGR